MSVTESISCETDFVRCYAIRRVNPFLGVLQVIKTNGGRAISVNGVVWDIEVLTEQTDEWGSLSQNNADMAYYRYGLWSAEEGLVHRPLAPHLENDPLADKCNIIIKAILKHSPQLPFKLQDKRELWLFDKEGEHPLALLASMVEGQHPPSPEPRHWVSSIGANGVPGQRKYPEAGQLENMVRKRAGFNTVKSWINRQHDGSGIVEKTKESIAVESFPAFLLAETWPDEAQSLLVSGFIDWISPSLLTLQCLNRQQRVRVEKSLNVQAISIEYHWHLYPEIIDEACLSAARVQCRFQKNEGST